MVLVGREGPVSAAVCHDIGVLSGVILSQEGGNEDGGHFVLWVDILGRRIISKNGKEREDDVIAIVVGFVGHYRVEARSCRAGAVGQEGRGSRAGSVPVRKISQIHIRPVIVVEEGLLGESVRKCRWIGHGEMARLVNPLCEGFAVGTG